MMSSSYLQYLNFEVAMKLSWVAQCLCANGAAKGTVSSHVQIVQMEVLVVAPGAYILHLDLRFLRQVA